MMKGKVFVISGPSGVGKGTICAALGKKYPSLAATTVSVTTRSPRPGEEEGVLCVDAVIRGEEKKISVLKLHYRRVSS